jgi:hypothetical protein
MSNNPLLWQVRGFVYNHFADTTRPPSVEDTAKHFSIEIEEAGALYKDLHNRHAFFLEPDTLNILMANPFSGIPTDFKVHADGKTYHANCAWDMLGIPVALHSGGVIEAVCTESNDPVQLEVRDGQIQAQAAVPGGDIKEKTGDVIWLMRGLVAISILDGIHYRPDDREYLARLFVAAEEKRLDPKPAFQLVSEISSNERPKPREISISELIADIPNIAHEIVDELKKWFTVEKEQE